MRYCSHCQALYPTDMQFCPAHGVPLAMSDDFTVGSVIKEKYEILAELGRGGMGRVFRVRDLDFPSGRDQSALKVPAEELVSQPGFIEHFRDEAAKARLLNHPNVVRIEHIDWTDERIPLLVMELIEGYPLRHWIDPILQSGWRQAAGVALAIVRALEAAHATGLVHCDIKPENVLSVGPGAPMPLKVTDFGLAKTTTDLLDRMSRMYRSSWATGFIAGTRDYMAPEQLTGREHVGPPADIFSLGVVLFELLTGDLPHAGALAADPALRTPSGFLRARPGLPLRMIDLVLQMLAGPPKSRPSAAEVASRLEDILSGSRPAPAPSPVMPSPGPAVAEPPRPVQTPPLQVVPPLKPAVRGRFVWLGLGALVLGLGFLGIHALLSSNPQPGTSRITPAISVPPDPVTVPSNRTPSRPDLETWFRSALVASQGPFVAGLHPYYADTVAPCYKMQSATWDDIARDKAAYFDRFPTIQYELVSFESNPTGGGSAMLRYSTRYTAIRKDGVLAHGLENGWAMVRFEDGAWRICGIGDR